MERRDESNPTVAVDDAVVAALASSAGAASAGIVREIARQSVALRRSHRPMSILVFRLWSPMDVVDDPRETKKALKRLLTRVSEGLRHTDSCGIVGDREVVSILPGASLDGARIAADRVSQGKTAPVLRGTTFSIMIGLAELSAADDDVERYVARARSTFVTPH